MNKTGALKMYEANKARRATRSLGLACAAIALALSGNAFAKVGGELQVMAWEGYDLTSQLQAWRKENGVKLQSASIAAQDDVHTKFLAPNPPPIDLAEYNQAYSDLYVKQLKIVKEVDVSKVPNYSADNLFSVFIISQPGRKTASSGAFHTFGVCQLSCITLRKSRQHPLPIRIC